MLPIGLQLYTVREETEKDFIGTLEKIATLGYKGVEFAGYGDISAEEMKKHLERLNLVAIGSHVMLELLRESLDEIIEYNTIIGSKYIICPYSKWESEDECLTLAKELNIIGSKINKNGMILCYHNHDHEFELINGEFGLDYLYANTNPEHVQAEIDTHWVKRAEILPTKYLKQYVGRCPLVHIKDMQVIDGEKTYAAIGEGMMDIQGIARVAEEVGTTWLIVENDQPKPNGMENIKTSIDNLRNMKLI